MEINVTRRVLQGAVVLDIPFFNFFYVIIYLFRIDWVSFSFSSFLTVGVQAWIIVLKIATILQFKMIAFLINSLKILLKPDNWVILQCRYTDVKMTICICRLKCILDIAESCLRVDGGLLSKLTNQVTYFVDNLVL